MGYSARYIIVIATSLAIIALLWTGISRGEAVDAMDLAIANWVEGLRTPWLTELMLAITALGDAGFLTLTAIVVVMALLLSGTWRMAIAYAVSFAGMAVLIRILKDLVQRPRPTVDLYGGVEAFSFPSGHAANSMMIYGAIALLVLMRIRRPIHVALAAAFTLLPLVISASRVYLGAHWPSDTIAGLALGAAALAALAGWLEAQPRPERPSRAIPVGIFLITLAFPIYLMVSLPSARAMYTAVEAPAQSVPPSP